MASKRNKRRQSCAGKKQYANQSAAVTAVVHLRQRGEKGLHSYKCPFCKHWHVGHRMKDTWEAMRNRGTA